MSIVPDDVHCAFLVLRGASRFSVDMVHGPLLMCRYWQTADEKSGKGPMSSPLPYIALLGILSPFLILAVAYFNNWIKVPAS